VKILIPTDAFPPVCGGSGWSTHALAAGLRARGHVVAIVRPVQRATEDITATSYDGFSVTEFGFRAPGIPYARNYFKNERLYARLGDFLEQRIRSEHFDIVHAQHVMTTLPSISAAARTSVPSVATVRDYWPVCYWSDLIHTRDDQALCPGCSARMMTRCIQPRAGTMWPLALPMIPYMRANLAHKRQGLAGAHAVIAVSSRIGSDLRERAPELATTRLEIIPNPVDLADLRARARNARCEIGRPYALYLGKLAPNKGTNHLVDVAETANLDWPLVIAGDGPDREAIAAVAAASTRDIRLLGWVDRDRAIGLMAHAAMLVFPSRGPESLSRVLLEACALGIPVAAMNTGGTPDIIVQGESGLLSTTAAELARDVRALRADEALRQRLSVGGRRHIEERFDAAAVIQRIEALYRELIGDRR
jgi:glycosyltransferase involved in cell wall biosynthesis